VHVPEKSIAHERNMWTLVSMLWGTMREVTHSLDAMRKAGVRRCIKDDKVWNPLDDIRKRWSRDLAIRIRNQLAFHTGDVELFIAGLDAWTVGQPLVLRRGQFTEGHAYERDSRSPFGFDLLFKGLGLSLADVTRFASEASSDHFALGHHLQCLLGEVLRVAGVRLQEPAALDAREELGAASGSP